MCAAAAPSLGSALDQETGGMKYFTAKDAKNAFGRLLDAARSEPTLVCKHGRPVAVVMAYEEYERLAELEAAYWASQAGQADDEGYLGGRQSHALLRDRLRLVD